MQQYLENYIQVINSQNTCLIYKIKAEPNKEAVKQLTDLQLIKAYSETREENLWQEFYSRFNKSIKHYVNKLLMSYQRKIHLTQEDFLSLKEDLVQEIYLKLLKNDCRVLKNYKGANNCFHSYLYKIARSVVIEYFRQSNQQKRQAKLVSLDNLVGENYIKMFDKTSKNISVTSIENKCVLEDLFQKTLDNCKNERNKKIFFFVVVLGMTATEISRFTSIPVTYGAVDSVIKNYKKKLKQLVA